MKIIFSLLIDFTENMTAPWWHGFAYAIGLFVAAEARSILLNNYFYLMFRVGIKVQSVLISAVYKKVLPSHINIAYKNVKVYSTKIIP